MKNFYFLILLLMSLLCKSLAQVELGVDVFFSGPCHKEFLNKNIGLITNHTGVNRSSIPTVDLFKKNNFKLKALFSPEHGFQGAALASEKVKDGRNLQGVPIYSLYGNTRRPSQDMLKGIDVLVYDIQDIGIRSYTYSTTLFYAMEEAAKKKIEVVVLDRPNPINGLTVDGPMLEEKWRSFIGYINIPYCHGMTIGELAHFFNEEYKIHCELKVVPMSGWKRSMAYSDTGLRWIPPSPHIPESDTPYFYASTGILGEIEVANIGIGYTLPFKVVGAEWINAEEFAEALNKLKLAGVHFNPFHYKPFYGTYKGKQCHGVLIVVDDATQYKPLSVQYAILGILKSLYPKIFKIKLDAVTTSKKELFCKACGSDGIISMLQNEQYVTYKLMDFHNKERESFLMKRKKYLRPEYQN